MGESEDSESSGSESMWGSGSESISGSSDSVRVRNNKNSGNSSSKEQPMDKRVARLEKTILQLIQGKIPTDLSSIFTSNEKESKVAGKRKSSRSNDRKSVSKDKRSKYGESSKRSISVESEEEDNTSQGEWECTICKKKYGYKGHLFRHYRVNHGEASPERVHHSNTAKVKRKCMRNSIDKKSPKGKAVSKNKKDKDKDMPLDCKLCESLFNSKSARNSHYTGRHQVANEKLLFFPNGTALVESTLEHHVSLKPDWFNAATKRNISSRVCKLCECVELDKDDLKWHYENTHKVFQISKIKNLIRLTNSDIKTVADSQKCNQCSAAFDNPNKLKTHLTKTHGVLKCKFCDVNVQRKLYNRHIESDHADMYFKKVSRTLVTVKGVSKKRNRVGKKVLLNKTKSRFKCSQCPRKFSSLVMLREHKRAAHKKADTSKNNKESAETPTCQIEKENIAEVLKETMQEQQGKMVCARRASLIPKSSPAVMMYLCDTCEIANTSYDDVVSHCQDHILNKANTEMTLCTHCDLKFGADFNTHMQMHSINADIDRDSFRYVTYNYRYLMSDKWSEMFADFTKPKVDRIVSASIYFTTRCVRFKIQSNNKDASAPFTLFQCVICNKYVDPFSIVSHVEQQNACSNQLCSYPCYVCLKQFYTRTARDQHDLTHKVPNAETKYRTVLFNDQNDLEVNQILLQAAAKGAETHGVKNVTDKTPIGVTTQKVLKDAQIDGKVNKMSIDHGETDGHTLKAREDKVANVYKCQCGLCFDRLKFLFKHLKNCSPALRIVTINCKCGLVFDTHNYVFHCKVHRDNITTFNVKEVIVRDERNVDVRGMAEEFKKNYRKRITLSKEVKQGTDQVNEKHINQEPKFIFEEDTNQLRNKKPSEEISLQGDQILVHLENDRLTNVKYAEMSKNVVSQHKSIDEGRLKEKKSQTNVLNSKQDEINTMELDIQNEVKLTELDCVNVTSKTYESENQFAMEVAEDNIVMESYDNLGNGNEISIETEIPKGNQSLLLKTTEVKLKQVHNKASVVDKKSIYEKSPPLTADECAKGGHEKMNVGDIPLKENAQKNVAIHGHDIIANYCDSINNVVKLQGNKTSNTQAALADNVKTTNDVIEPKHQIMNKHLEAISEKNNRIKEDNENLQVNQTIETAIESEPNDAKE